MADPSSLVITRSKWDRKRDGIVVMVSSVNDLRMCGAGCDVRTVDERGRFDTYRLADFLAMHEAHVEAVEPVVETPVEEEPEPEAELEPVASGKRGKR